MADFIQQLIEGMGAMLAKVLGKEAPKNELVIYDETEFANELYQNIMQLLEQGEICKAEDALFFELENEFTEGKYWIGVALYDNLHTLDEAYLTERNFSKAEVEQGMAELERLKSRHDANTVRMK